MLIILTLIILLHAGMKDTIAIRVTALFWYFYILSAAWRV